MFKRSKLLLLFTLTLVAGTLYWGCDQPEDVLTPITKTNVWLQEERLPDNPPGMVYELWVANSTDTISLGKFGYNFELRKYYTTAQQLRADSNSFSLDNDIEIYNQIFVSVETNPDDNLNSPGPIMLIDNIINPTVKMVFPMVDVLWEGTVWYSMESVSDGRDSITDGHALWFCGYDEITIDWNDTNSILDWSIDSSLITDSIPDTNIIIIGIDSNSIIHDTLTVIKGLDTLTRRVVRFDVILDTVTVAPYYNTFLSVTYDYDSTRITYDDFNQGDTLVGFGLPDVSEYGWRYKGWVVAPQIPQEAVGAITYPAWEVLGSEFEDTDGGLISTGSFYQVRGPDDSNLYVVSDRVPPYPGEDFLQNLPFPLDTLTNGLNLVPNVSGGNPGRVFFSFEPDNAVTDSTNFPLIPFLGKLPDARSMVTGTGIQQFMLRGYMYSNDPLRGFPKITVEYVRF